MVSLLPSALTKARTAQNPPAVAAPAPAGPVPPRPEEHAPVPGRGLRCLWYDDVLADTLTTADEFLRTPAAIATLAEFYRARCGSRAPEFEARALIDAVGWAAARLCG
jgi:hypothetical protein